MSESVADINFFDPATNDCPYHAYQAMRDDAPVWKDPITGMYFLTQYADIRMVLLDTKRFLNRVGSGAGNTEKAIQPDDPEAAKALLDAAKVDAQIKVMYEEQGWLPASTLDGRDEPEHMQMRRLFDHAFRPKRVSELDPHVEKLAVDLIDGWIDKGECEFVADFAVPLPLYIIGMQMGVPAADMPMIKNWTDAWVKRMGLAQTAEERIWSAEQEIEAQQYFQPLFEKLRKEPEDTLLSDLVNNEIPEWGRPLNDNELHAEMMADLFVGGSETSTNAIAAGVMLLIQQPDVWKQLKSDPDKYLGNFCEEVLRLESPVQGLLREAAEDIELHGVTIPAGAIINLRYAAGNRDDRRYDGADQIDLEREQPRTHLAFGVGTHHCLGAPLARRELYWSFKVIVDRIDEMWFIEGKNDFSYHPNFFLRAIKELHIGFKPVAA